MAEILCCYAHEDELLLKKLKSHLRPLQRQHLIDVWYDRDINAGVEWEREIDKHLNEADIILLLVSPDFIDSDYCYSIEMQRAIERHDNGEAQVIPIILRPVYWRDTPFGKLQVLPSNARPVTEWGNRDKALLDIATGIRRVVTQEPPDILAPTNAKYSSLSRFTRLNMPLENPSTRKSAMLTHQHFRPGDIINHPIFGDGIVLSSKFVNNSEIVELQFEGEQRS